MESLGDTCLTLLPYRQTGTKVRHKGQLIPECPSLQVQARLRDCGSCWQEVAKNRPLP